MKYRIRPYDLMYDIWVVYERRWFFFWVPVGTGKKAEVEAKLKTLLCEDAR